MSNFLAIILGFIAPSYQLSLIYFYFFQQKIEAQTIEEFYGLTSDIHKSSESGYILFYEAKNYWKLTYNMNF